MSGYVNGGSLEEAAKKVVCKYAVCHVCRTVFLDDCYIFGSIICPHCKTEVALQRGVVIDEARALLDGE